LRRLRPLFRFVEERTADRRARIAAGQPSEHATA
jgi:hypothetical protein